MALRAPYPGQLKPGMQGPCVAAMQGALRAWALEKRPPGEPGTRGYAATGKWQGPTTIQVKHFQDLHAIDQSGVVGPVTWAALDEFFTPYGVSIVKKAVAAERETADRDRIVDVAKFHAAHRSLITYTQAWPGRMAQVVYRLRRPNFPKSGDCSGMLTGWYWEGTEGRVDPNGRGFDGYGFTGTQWPRGERVGVGELRPGDAVFYGWDGRYPTHVAVYIGGGQVVSHGSSQGPLIVPVSYRPVTGCRSYLP